MLSFIALLIFYIKGSELTQWQWRQRSLPFCPRPFWSWRPRPVFQPRPTANRSKRPWIACWTISVTFAMRWTTSTYEKRLREWNKRCDGLAKWQGRLIMAMNHQSAKKPEAQFTQPCTWHDVQSSFGSSSTKLECKWRQIVFFCCYCCCSASLSKRKGN